jgi:hypothetical protein
MNNDLIVITFDDEDEAEKVLDALQAMRRGTRSPRVRAGRPRPAPRVVPR